MEHSSFTTFCMLVLFLTQVDGKFEVIKSPTITDNGPWGKFDNCDSNQLVIGVVLETCGMLWATIRNDHSGLTGIILLCRNGKNSSIKVISSSKGEHGEIGNPYYCPNYGYATGFQLRSQPNAFREDDRGATNFRLYCSDGSSFESYAEETEMGNWTERQNCPPSHYICGIRTQVENFNDASGINNVEIKCCEIEPISCENEIQTTEIASYDNRKSSTSTKLVLTAKFGIIIENHATFRYNNVQELQLQLGLKVFYKSMLASLTAIGKNVNENEWNFANKETWKNETELSLEYEVEAGVKTIIYQEVMKCGEIKGFGRIIREDLKDFYMYYIFFGFSALAVICLAAFVKYKNFFRK